MKIERKNLKKLWDIYGQEVREKLPEFIELHKKHTNNSNLEIRRHATGQIAGSINLSDGIYLYLLVRAHKPKTIFEIGTWIGTSALFMAEAIKKNGVGHIYTCDINDFYSLSPQYDSYITRINESSDDALKRLPDASIDFFFADGTITRKTASLLRKKLSGESISVTHDFLFPGDKGLMNAILIRRSYKRHASYMFPWWPLNIAGEITTSDCSLAIITPDRHIDDVHRNTILQPIWMFMFDTFFFASSFFGAFIRKINPIKSR